MGCWRPRDFGFGSCFLSVLWLVETMGPLGCKRGFREMWESCPSGLSFVTVDGDGWALRNLAFLSMLAPVGEEPLP